MMQKRQNILCSREGYCDPLSFTAKKSCRQRLGNKTLRAYCRVDYNNDTSFLHGIVIDYNICGDYVDDAKSLFFYMQM